MKSISGLVCSLKKSLGWNKARCDCFARMLLGLIAVKTVNLQEIATGMSSSANLASRYRRLQRFFALFQIDFVSVSRWIFFLFFSNTKKYYVIIDRTDWCWGKKKINIFMLSIAYEGLAIPICWQLLNKKGSSNFGEQKALINQFTEIFGTKNIEALLADREFANGNFFDFLTKQNIPFCIRIKDGSIVRIKKTKIFKVEKIFNDLNPKTKKTFGVAVEIFDAKVYLSGARSEKGELMVVATNRPMKDAIAVYLRRWEIENLFQALKGRGFRFEETHITDPERISKLIVLLAIGFAWAHKIGEWLAEQKPIVFKRFKDHQTPQNTFFRYGLDNMRDIILHVYEKVKMFKEILGFIVPPPLQEAFS
jgi:hypothetical protein